MSFDFNHFKMIRLIVSWRQKSCWTKFILRRITNGNKSIRKQGLQDWQIPLWWTWNAINHSPMMTATVFYGRRIDLSKIRKHFYTKYVLVQNYLHNCNAIPDIYLKHVNQMKYVLSNKLILKRIENNSIWWLSYLIEIWYVN